MQIKRREFIGSAMAFAGIASAQEGGAPHAGDAPVRTPKVEKVFLSPDKHPNALEATRDGLWIGDQVSERIHHVDWKTGKVLHEVQGYAHNTSGVAVGAGYLWISANGSSRDRRSPRPQDNDSSEVMQADLKTGKTIKVHKLPWPGGLHGITYVEQTGTLWLTALGLNALAEMSPADFRVLRMIPVKYPRAHGVDWSSGSLWCLFSSDRLVQRLDPTTGRVLETVKFANTDPDPHGMCIHDGYMYYCDAGLTATSPGTAPGAICRFKL